jgi:hypothetical protein
MPQNIRATTTTTTMPRRFSLADRWGSSTSPNNLSASSPPPEAFAAAQYLERKGEFLTAMARDHQVGCHHFFPPYRFLDAYGEIFFAQRLRATAL